MKKLLIAALMTCLLVSCGISNEPVAVAPTNMGDVTFSFDGLIEGESALITTGTIAATVASDNYPIFYNGNVLPADVTFYYDSTTEPMVDFCALIDEICGYSDISRGDDSWIIRYSFKIYGAHESINPKDLVMLTFDIGSDTVNVGGNNVTVTVPVSMTARADGIMTIMLPYTDAAKILGLETHFYGSEDVEAWGRNPDTNIVEQANGSPYYISGTPHLMFWNYPESAEIFTADEAVEIARGKLITAYEQKWGQYSPLTPEECDALGGDQGHLNEKIQELTVTSENDRFYRIPFWYDFLVDKYTGDVITQYNGIVEVFRRFDPYSEGALTFAG